MQTKTRASGSLISLAARRWMPLLVVAAMIVIASPITARADDATATKKEDAASTARYTSTGLVSVRAKDLGELEIEQVTQARLMTHPALVTHVLGSSDAVRKTAWFKQFIGRKDSNLHVDIAAAKADLMAHFHVNVIPKSRLIEVKMTCADAQDSQVILREVVDQFIKDQKDHATQGMIERVQAMEQLKLNYESQVRDLNARMSRIAADLGGAGSGTGEMPDARSYELQQLISEQLYARASEVAAEAKLKTFENQMAKDGAPDVEIAPEKNPLYAEYRRDVDELELAYADIVSSLGAKAPRANALKHRLDAMQQKLADMEKDIKSHSAASLHTELARDLTLAAATVKRINDRLAEVRDETKELAKLRNEYNRLQQESTVTNKQLDEVKKKQDQLGFLFSGTESQPVGWAASPDLPDARD